MLLYTVMFTNKIHLCQQKCLHSSRLPGEAHAIPMIGKPEPLVTFIFCKSWNSLDSKKYYYFILTWLSNPSFKNNIFKLAEYICKQSFATWEDLSLTCRAHRNLWAWVYTYDRSAEEAEVEGSQGFTLRW